MFVTQSVSSDTVKDCSNPAERFSDLGKRSWFDEKLWELDGSLLVLGSIRLDIPHVVVEAHEQSTVTCFIVEHLVAEHTLVENLQSELAEA